MKFRLSLKIPVLEFPKKISLAFLSAFTVAIKAELREGSA